MPEQPRRPEVTLVGGSLPAGPLSDGGEPEPAEPRRRPPIAVLLAVVAAVLLVAAVRAPDASPEPAGPAATLALGDGGINITQYGVLVVPVELRNEGPALAVRKAWLYAEPVVADPVVQAPTEVAAGDSRRFVALVAPDCRLLRPGSPLRFIATVMLRVGLGSSSQDLVVDLAASPEVTAAVEGLCRSSD